MMGFLNRLYGRRPTLCLCSSRCNLSFSTDVLDKDITLSGEIKAMLKVATSGTDADWVVKVIDCLSSRRSREILKRPEVMCMEIISN